MRPSWIVGVVIGILILYLGMFGLAGFGMSTLSLAGAPYRADFNDTSGWYVVSGTTFTVSGGIGTVSIPASMSGGMQTTAGTFLDPGTQYTITFRMNLQTCSGVGCAAVTVYGTGYWIPWSINGSYISEYEGANPRLNCHLPNDITGQWHNWTMLVTASTGSMDIYMDSTKMLPTSGAWNTVTVAGLAPKVCVDLYAGSTGGTAVLVDFIYGDDGLHPPGSSTPVSGNGWILAHCTSSSSPLSGVSVSASGPSTGSATSGSDGLATITGLAAGTYSVAATYGGVTKSNTGVVVTANAGADTYLDFTPNAIGTGSITVSAQDVNGKSITVTVTLTGPTTVSHDTPYTFTSLPYGSYSVAGTWKGETQTQSATISSTTTSTSVTLHYTQADTGTTDILALLRAYITKYQTPIMAFGGILTLLSAIMFVLPAPKNYYTRPQGPYQS